MKTITIELTEAEAQTIVNALATLPYAQVAHLIPKIIAQANSQMAPNGADTSVEAQVN